MTHGEANMKSVIGVYGTLVLKTKVNVVNKMRSDGIDNKHCTARDLVCEM